MLPHSNICKHIFNYGIIVITSNEDQNNEIPDLINKN